MIRTLIVDDSAIILRTLPDLLRSYPDIDVVGLAKDGLEAIERSLELLPDVVIMDIQMPTMDGLEATRCIKKALPAVGVLFLSTHTDHIEQTISAGGDGYLTKPPGREELVSKMRQIAAKYRHQTREDIVGSSAGRPRR